MIIINCPECHNELLIINENSVLSINRKKCSIDNRFPPSDHPKKIYPSTEFIDKLIKQYYDLNS